MKKILLVLLFVTMMLTTIPAQEVADCSELFFSEYVEGSGNSKALEIYNPTDQVIDLSYYFVARFSNGSSTYDRGGYTHLQGFIEPHKVFILVNGQTEDITLGNGTVSPKCDPALHELVAQFNHQLDHGYPAPTYMNGNDAIALLRSESKDISSSDVQIIDLIGQVGLGNKIAEEYGWSNVQDSLVPYHYMTVSGTDTTWVETAGWVNNYIVQHTDTAGTAPFGPYWMAWTKDHTLVRKPSVTKGVTKNPDMFNVAMEWDTVPGGRDVWDSLGFHTCNCGVTAVHDPSSSSPEVYTYPNPVTYHTFDIISNRPIRQVAVTNLLGQQVHRSTPGETYDRRYRVVLPGNTPPGIYLVRVTLEHDRTTVKKILVK